MKKTIALLLTLVLCLSLCACGNGETNYSESTLGDIPHPDADPLVPSMGDTGPTVFSTEPDTKPSEGKELQDIGETKLMSMRERDDRPLIIELHEDKTCTIDGKTYTWTQENDSYDMPLVFIMDGAEQLYRMEFGNGSGKVDVYRGDDYFIYLDLEVYERVELTVENWDTYFEIKDTFQIIKDAFGDFKHADLRISYNLRDSYFDRIYNKGGSGLYSQDNVAVEVQIAYQYARYTIDMQNENYTVEPDGSIELQKKVCDSRQESNYFSVYVDWVSVNEEKGTFSYPVEITPQRVNGYLWLKKV